MDDPFQPSGADEAVPLPVDGTLDLHTFRPQDIGALIPDYLEACRERGITTVRIVHGKGRGMLRRGVHAVLDRLPGIRGYRLGDQTTGGWGATVVELEPAPPAGTEPAS